MSKTYINAGDAIIKTAVIEQLFRESVKQSYFKKFMGSSPDSICQEKTDLEKDSGDKMVFTFLSKLAGTGVTGTSGQALEGNEEKLNYYSDTLYLEEYAHAVRDRGALDRQRFHFSIDTESREALKNWMAEKIDQLCFDALTYTAYTKIFYGGSATSAATLTTSDKLTPAMISKAKAWALTGGRRAQNPLRPVKVDGKSHYIMLVHPEVMYDLKQDGVFTQAMREAEVRGKENPLFNGAVAIWDNVVIHEHENIPVAANGGSGSDVPYAKCVLLGAQSLVWAWGKRPEIVAETFDYGREHGFAIKAIAKCKKPVFNSVDYGCAGIYVARTSI